MTKFNSFGRFIFTVLVLFLAWVFLTNSLHRQKIFMGVIVSTGIGLLTYSRFTEGGMESIYPRKIVMGVLYLPYLLWQMILANLDVAYRVLHPERPINPGIVEVKTDLKPDIGKLALANSITLTPGTMSVDVEDDSLYIHWIDVEDEGIEGASEEIVKPFEKYLRRVFNADSD